MLLLGVHTCLGEMYEWVHTHLFYILSAPANEDKEEVYLFHSNSYCRQPKRTKTFLQLTGKASFFGTVHVGLRSR